MVEHERAPSELLRAVAELDRVGVLEPCKLGEGKEGRLTTQAVRCLRCGYDYLLIHHHRRGVQANVCPSCSYAGWEPRGQPRRMRHRLHWG